MYPHPGGLIDLPGSSSSKFRKGLSDQLQPCDIIGTSGFAMQKLSMQMGSMTANLFLSLPSGSTSNIWSFPCQADLQIVLWGNRPHGHHVPILSSSNSLHIQEEASEDETNYYLHLEITL